MQDISFKWKKLKIAVSESDSLTMCFNLHESIQRQSISDHNYAGWSRSNFAQCKLTPQGSVWFLSGDGNRVNVGIFPQTHTRPTR